MRKLIYIFVLIFIFSFTDSLAQRESQFKREKKEVFKKNSFGKNKKPETKGPPGPGGGGGGNPVPISGGAFLLAGGLLIYSLYRNKSKDA